MQNSPQCLGGQGIALLLLRCHKWGLVYCYMVTTCFHYIRTAATSTLSVQTFCLNKCIIWLFEVHFFLLEFSVLTHYSHYLYYKVAQLHELGRTYSDIQVYRCGLGSSVRQWDLFHPFYHLAGESHAPASHLSSERNHSYLEHKGCEC